MPYVNSLGYAQPLWPPAKLYNVSVTRQKLLFLFSANSRICYMFYWHHVKMVGFKVSSF